jgi:hypothetical protein
MELDMDTVEERMEIAKGRITISETNWLEELEKLTVEKIIAKYVNYSTMASVETPVKQSTAHQSPAHSKSKKIAVKQPTAHSSTAHSSPAHSSPAKQPPAEFTILTIAQVLAKPRLHREDTHGQHEPAAGGGDEKVHPSDKPRPEDQQVLAAEDQQVLAPKAQQILAPVDSTSTVVGLIGGEDPCLQVRAQDPGPQEGGQDPSLQEGGRDPDPPVGGQDPGQQVGGRDPNRQMGKPDPGLQVGGQGPRPQVGGIRSVANV